MCDYGGVPGPIALAQFVRYTRGLERMELSSWEDQFAERLGHTRV